MSKGFLSRRGSPYPLPKQFISAPPIAAHLAWRFLKMVAPKGHERDITIGKRSADFLYGLITILTNAHPKVQIVQPVLTRVRGNTSNVVRLRAASQI